MPIPFPTHPLTSPPQWSSPLFPMFHSFPFHSMFITFLQDDETVMDKGVTDEVFEPSADLEHLLKKIWAVIISSRTFEQSQQRLIMVSKEKTEFLISKLIRLNHKHRWNINLATCLVIDDPLCYCNDIFTSFSQAQVALD